MRRFLILPLLLPLIGAVTPDVRPRPVRIVSLNLCADQYLLALADRRQVAALTVFARDQTMSAAAAKARVFPTTRGSAEDIITLRPDLVIASPGFRPDLLADLRRGGSAVVELTSANDYPTIVAQIRLIAAAIGHPTRGEALIAGMNRRLKSVSRNAGGGAIAAYYQRRGFLTGAGTLVDDLFHRVGLRNLARQLRKPVLSRVSLEEMALARPKYLIVETETDQIADQGTEMLHHPVLNGIRRLRLPQAWTVCGGPAYISALESLDRQLREQRQKRDAN